MIRILCLLAFPALLSAADWLEFRSGPFIVLTAEGEKAGRETLNYLEQLRYALGTQLGQADLNSVWPIRVLVLKERNKAELQPKLLFSRDGWVCSITTMNPETAAGVTRVLLDSWPGIIPGSLLRGLIQLYATLDVDGTRVTLGAVPSRKDRDWSRAHMLAVLPEYSGRLRTLLYNFGKGVDREVAFRNAFEKTPEQVETDLNHYIETGNYGTYPVSGKPLNPRKELLPKKADPATAALAVADLHFAAGSTNAYDALAQQYPSLLEAQEGLGLSDLKTSQMLHARSSLASAKSALPLVEYAKLVPDASTKRAILARAIAANKLWAEPHRLLAELETDSLHKLAELKTAAQLEPRNTATWSALAQLQEDNRMFAESAKSWAAAERAAADPADLRRIREARASMEQKKVEQQISDRESARKKADQEMQDLKNRALSQIRTAEARANAGKPTIDASKLPEYKEEQPGKLDGTLQRVECLGQQARLYVANGSKVVKLLVPDPSKVAIKGGGETALGCGIQKPPRHVSVEYTAPFAKGVAGEVTSIEFVSR